MSAETLRRAGALMREGAEKATGGPWSHTMATVEGAGTVAYDKHMLASDGEYIASWHPAVAVAVAAWLEEAADHLSVDTNSEDLPFLHLCPTAIEGLDCSVLEQSLAVARAYLGEDTP